MGVEKQLQWERDNARWTAYAAFLSALLTLAAGLYVRAKVSGPSSDSVEGILLVHNHKSDLLVAAIFQALGTALLVVPLMYLFRATRFRREQLPAALRYLVLVAPLLGAATLVARQIQIGSVADKVFPKLPLPPDAAKTLVDNEVGKGSLVAVGGIATAAALGLAFAFLLVSLNAMRAGLLSKFMGILGIIVGLLIVIPLQGDLPVVQVFWVAALGVLVLNRWPQGRGPAWESGEAIPWPTATDRRDALNPGEPRPERGAGRTRAAAAEPVADEPQHTGEPARPRQSTTHPRSKKRKRKRG